VRGRVEVCVWVAHDKIDRLFGDEDRRLAGFVATLAGAALENADAAHEVEAANVELTRQRQEIRRLSAAVVSGQEDERKRLSRALHDGAGQVLTLLAIELDREAAREQDATRAQRLRERSGMVNGLLLDLRRLSQISVPCCCCNKSRNAATGVVTSARLSLMYACMRCSA
jgi:signal transduction histidine kinase